MSNPSRQKKLLPVRQLALQVLPIFADNVLANRVTTYGVYAKAIGRDPAKEAITIGQAMHAIGGACVLGQVPIAPLYYLRRADGGWRGVFESDALEARDVLPHYDTLYVASREYKYTRQDFDRVERSLSKLVPPEWSAHLIWHIGLVSGPKGDDETYFAKALLRYQSIVETAKATSRQSRSSR